MPDAPWTFAREPVSTSGGGGTMTLVQESTFCISDAAGDVLPDRAQGLFFYDRRIVSQLELTFDGQRVEPLTATNLDPFSAVFVSRVISVDDPDNGELLVLRRRYVGRGLREDLEVRNTGLRPRSCRWRVLVDVDFADLFAVKEGRVVAAGPHAVSMAGDTIEHRAGDDAPARGMRVTFHGSGLHLDPSGASVAVELAGGEAWEGCIEVSPILGHRAIASRYPCGQAVESSVPSRRLATWREAAPVLTTDHVGLRHAVRRAVEDLGALRMFDPEHPSRAVVAAGAPWFMALFGRDSLLTAWMALIVDPSLAAGVLQTLARFQGTRVDPATDEEPGRILHEVRFDGAEAMSFGRGNVYYGTADATPLFVMLLGELHRWGLAANVVSELLPHADRALDWITTHGDRDGDGYVEYERASPTGLANQGWKDSWDSMRFADGRLAATPIALCEVQGYVYAAYLARAGLAASTGDHDAADELRRRAATLKQRFNEDFWVADRGWFALGLDRDKQPIDALGSNVGHCLWTGIVDERRSAAVAEQLVSPAMHSGWGLRTMASSMDAYSPLSYHNGSVWPHDTAIAAAGLMRYGRVEAAHQLIVGLLRAADASSSRLPELFAGLPTDEVPVPVPYPTACSPQAWASAAPLLMLRTLLRLEPNLPDGRVVVDPVLPDEIRQLRLQGVRAGDGVVSVTWEDDDWQASAPPGIDVVDARS